MAWAQRSRSALATLLALLVIGGASGCTSGGITAPDFVAQDLSGKAVRLAQFRGKVVFLNLWTTWCPPCREEMPAMQALATKLGGQDFVMLAVSEDDGGVPVVKQFVETMKLTFPVLVDPSGDVGRRYGVSGYPGDLHHRPRGTSGRPLHRAAQLARPGHREGPEDPDRRGPLGARSGRKLIQSEVTLAGIAVSAGSSVLRCRPRARRR